MMMKQKKLIGIKHLGNNLNTKKYKGIIIIPESKRGSSLMEKKGHPCLHGVRLIL